MAEIPIQRKPGAGIWPWIIALVVLLVLLWFFFSRNPSRATTAAPATTDSAMTRPDTTVR
jgi:protein-S-isoprenylcysteine O-methyltransferase Ste14